MDMIGPALPAQSRGHFCRPEGFAQLTDVPGHFDVPHRCQSVGKGSRGTEATASRSHKWGPPSA